MKMKLNKSIATTESKVSSLKLANSTLPTIALTATCSYFVTSTLFALFIFTQFNFAQILSVSTIFLLLLAFLVWLFFKPMRSDISISWRWQSVVSGLLFSAVMFVFSFTWLHSNGPAWQDYFPTFPMFNLENGLGFHQDSVFHISLIQSILNNGYPSTGQNGVPLVPYHVLSHYVDAGILAITGLQAFDSYSLLFYFKVVIQLSAITLFIWITLRKQRTWLFLVAWAFLTPVLVSDWINVGSHGLWFTSLILILGSPYVFEFLKQRKPSNFQFGIIFLVVILVGLGKVSSGLLFAVLLSLFLLLKNIKSKRTYLLVVSWLVFFGIYWRLFNTGQSSGIQRPHVSGFFGFLNYQTTYTPGPEEPNLLGIYLLAGLLSISFLIFRNKTSILMCVAGLLSVIALAIVTQVLEGLAQPDIFYFIYGLYLPFVLLGFMCLVEDLSSSPVDGWAPFELNTKFVKTSLVLLFCLCVFPLKLSTLNPFALSGENISKVLSDLNSGYFGQLNSSQNTSAISVLGELQGNLPPRDIEQNTDMYLFRKSLNSYLSSKHLEKKQVVMFVPKEILTSSSLVQNGPQWASGQLVYAVTGVPLINGILDRNIANFGQSSYGEDANAIELSHVTSSSLCNSGKTVVMVESFSPPQFELRCNSN